MMILVALMFLNSIDLAKVSIELNTENHLEGSDLNEP